MTPGEFVQELSKIRLDAVFNPYSQRCDVHDRQNAPACRQANLLAFIKAALDARVETIWIGRDLGYRGGRRTGLPLTDEVHLPAMSALFSHLPVRQATRGPALSERTATIIWQMLGRIGHPVFLWNIFPLHPHEPEDPLSNRCHTRRERLACEALFRTLLDLLQPIEIIAIGRDAYLALKELDIPCHRVRHPSYGGQAEFMQTIAKLYGVSSESRLDNAHLDPDIMRLRNAALGIV